MVLMLAPDFCILSKSFFQGPTYSASDDRLTEVHYIMLRSIYVRTGVRTYVLQAHACTEFRAIICALPD